jgi:hypothetical protein
VVLVINGVSEEPSKMKPVDKMYYLIFFRSMIQLLVTANVVPSSPSLVILMMEEIRSSRTSVLTRATRRNIPEDILHSHRSGNLKSYIL